jgi:hypothetical protein
MDTELGLKNLESVLKGKADEDSSSEYLDFVGWSRELRESLEKERRFVGLDQNEQMRRQLILRQLDSLALRRTGKSFFDLSRERLLPHSDQEVVESRPSLTPDSQADGGMQPRPIEVFFSYSHLDEDLRNNLEKHLSILQRQRVIRSWHDRKISASREWQGEILSSDYVYDVELQQAMERHGKGEALVIPIILSPCDWKDSSLGKLQALPAYARPITTWQNRDEAFLDVVKGIRAVIIEHFSRKT